MHGNLSAPAKAATFSTARIVRKLPDTADKTVGKTGSEWFPAACAAILGDDAGLQLQRITGFPERTCYRYASGESEPRDDFLRRLFHSAQGAPFHAAFMHDCTAQWWIEHQQERRVGQAAISEFKQGG